MPVAAAPVVYLVTAHTGEWMGYATSVISASLDPVRAQALCDRLTRLALATGLDPSQVEEAGAPGYRPAQVRETVAAFLARRLANCIPRRIDPDTGIWWTVSAVPLDRPRAESLERPERPSADGTPPLTG